MIRIGLLLIDGFALMSYSSVVEPLRAANLLSEKNFTAYQIYLREIFQLALVVQK